MLQKNILLIEDKKELGEILKTIFKKGSNYTFSLSNSKEENIKEQILNYPDIILINTDNILSVYEYISKNVDGYAVPVICFVENMDLNEKIKLFEKGIHCCIDKPIDKLNVYYIIRNYINLVDSNRIVSPLTGLPGNLQITREMKKRIMNKQDFAVLYCDLDNFKAYNDTYGFVKGDDVIKFTADVIYSTIKSDGDASNFIGHIGGDDFVAIVKIKNLEEICEEIIRKFDEGIKNMLGKSEIDRGFFEVPNRMGIIEQYPLTSISIGVVQAFKEMKITPLDIGEIGAQLKHKAKTIPGSAYTINKRNI